MNKLIVSSVFATGIIMVPSTASQARGPCDYILKQNCGGPSAQSCSARSKNYSRCLKNSRPKNPHLGQQETPSRAINNSGRSSGKVTRE